MNRDKTDIIPHSNPGKQTNNPTPKKLSKLQSITGITYCNVIIQFQVVIPDITHYWKKVITVVNYIVCTLLYLAFEVFCQIPYFFQNQTFK